uniref:Uncharacterized protein n=1 Tax=Rhizophora mucronata TaxID=61149 RepID=A0A2P2KPE8_RHIMU
MTFQLRRRWIRPASTVLTERFL